MNEIVHDKSTDSAGQFTKGTVRPRKKIVIFGLWLLHTTVISACSFVWFVLLFLDQQPIADKFPLALVFLLPTAFVSVLSMMVLVKSTKNYLRDKWLVTNKK